MRMKTQKTLKKGSLAKALLLCSFTVFLFLGAGVASADHGGEHCVVCGCPCPGTHDGNAPPFCDARDGNGNYHPRGNGGMGGWHGRCRAKCKQGIFA